MFISFKIILLFALVARASLQDSRLNLGDIKEWEVKNNWKSVEARLMQAEEIIIHYSGLTEASLQQMLSLRMPKLRTLSFGNYHFDVSQPASLFNLHNHQFLTHKLLAAIFTSQYLDQIVELNLIGTNLDDKSWRFLEEMDWRGRSLSVEKLLLGNNYIGTEGFRSLAVLPLHKLTEIDLSNNLLIDSQAVTSVLQIMCQNESADCSKQLKSLDVSSTNINSEGLIRLLSAIDPHSLLHLNISNLNLHHKNKYHEGYNLEVYQFLANMSFPNLRQLQMNDLSLDSVIFPILSSWKFPALESLALSFNFLDDRSLKGWLTTDNFPQLSRLVLAGTDIKDEGLEFLVKQHLRIKELNIGMTMLSRKGLRSLKDMDTSTLQKLFLKSLSIESATLKQIFLAKEFSNLQELSLTGNKQIMDLLEYFPWEKMGKLQKLILTDCRIESSFKALLQRNQTLLPDLKYLMFNGTGLDPANIIRFLTSSQVLFPSLRFANLVPVFHQPINFTQLALSPIHEGLDVDLGYVLFKRTGAKLELKQVKSLSWLALYSSQYSLFEYFDPTSEHYIKLESAEKHKKPLTDELCHNITKEMIALFSIASLELITIANQAELEIFLEWIKIQKIKEFPHLITLFLSISIEVDHLTQILSDLSLPLLRNLRINIQVRPELVNFDPLIKPLQSFPNLIDLRLRMSYPVPFNRQKDYNSFLNQLKYPYLMQLDLSGSNLQTEEVGGIIYNHIPTLRFLNVHSNFIEHNFLKMIAEYQLTLKTLDISFISFPPLQFGEFAKGNLGFVTDLVAEKCELTDEHIIAWIEGNKHKYFLPKLGMLDLNENEIHEKGIRLLLQQSLHQLISFRIKRNYNPHFLNMLLTYTTKINELVAVDVEIYALDKHIQPISTRRILVFAIQSYSFSDEDYAILGSLNFDRLQLSQIETKNVYDCKNLEQLLKISARARAAWIIFKGDQQKLNSSCLSLSSETYKDFESQVEEVGLGEATDQTYIPEFIELVMSTKRNWRRIILENLRLPPSVFLKIDPASLDQLTTFYACNSHIDDEAFSRILQSPLSSIQFIRICDTDITLKSLRLLANRTFAFLEQLDLSGISLEDEGVDILTTINARKLKLLILKRCNIRSLKRFNEMKFPEVYQLEFSYSYLTAGQIIDFLKNLDRKVWPSLIRMDARGITPTVAELKLIDEAADSQKIIIKFDGPHNIEMANSANY